MHFNYFNRSCLLIHLTILIEVVYLYILSILIEVFYIHILTILIEVVYLCTLTILLEVVYLHMLNISTEFAWSCLEHKHLACMPFLILHCRKCFLFCGQVH